MTRIRRILLLSAAAGHLGLVVAGGLDASLWSWGPVGRALTYYGVLSGVGSGYSFFAPTVRAAPDVTFTLVDGTGGREVDSLLTGVTREADLRVQDVVDVMWNRRADDSIRRQVAASWAAVMFARHPAAESVVVDVGHARLPTMAQLREGARPGWKSKYRARVVRQRAGAEP